MKRTSFFLFTIGAVLLFDSCATIRPVTDRIIEDVGGEDQLSRFQYYVSRDIVLSRTESETDANVTQGRANIVRSTQRDQVNIRKSTPGIVVMHRPYQNGDASTYILGVAFEDDDSKLLMFAHPGKSSPNAPYRMVTSLTDKDRVVYGSGVYSYSFPDKWQVINNMLRKNRKRNDEETPCLLIKYKQKLISKKNKRTAKGRRIQE